MSSTRQDGTMKPSRFARRWQMKARHLREHMTAYPKVIGENACIRKQSKNLKRSVGLLATETKFFSHPPWSKDFVQAAGRAPSPMVLKPGWSKKRLDTFRRTL